MHKVISVRSLILALAVSSAAGVGYAQPQTALSEPTTDNQTLEAPAAPATRIKVREACQADFAKVCPTANDRATLRQCAMTHQADFSAQCKAAIAARAARRGGGGE